MVGTMKMWQYAHLEAGLEDAIHLVTGPIPTASSLVKDQILVRVLNVSINPVDYKLPESFMESISVRRPAIPGLDFCGRVIAAHTSVHTFTEGQLVFGGFSRTPQNGTLAEYTVITAAECAALPVGIDPEQAAAAATAATTALQSLPIDVVKPGATVFINGGSGGVGSWGLQFAKAMGARFVTSCSGTAVELCKQLGADEVIDYRESDIIAELKGRGAVFDLVVDNVGNTSDLYDLSSTILKPGGTFVQVGIGGTMDLKSIAMIVKRSLLTSVLVGRRNYYFVKANNSTELLTQIAQWMAEGKAKAVIDCRFALEEVPQSFRQLKKRHTRGKIVIRVAGLRLAG
ncbi:putative zinc alcohol dehydrogenase [Aspergillus pseudodeflectus]|uniref:Zinc alcohol dehydrogenase n=1 Tax=Aspergillus pseudodeflectus TaxID=176178 RepID=A0ABR4JQF6_9EURO